MYFDHIKSIDEIKARYKILAKRLHPDIGGDTTIMQEINREYEEAIKPKVVSKPKPYKSTDQNKIDSVLDWAKDNFNFDTTFVDSLAKRLDSGRNLTNAQVYALDNIIRRFRINIREL